MLSLLHESNNVDRSVRSNRYFIDENLLIIIAENKYCCHERGRKSFCDKTNKHYEVLMSCSNRVSGNFIKLHAKYFKCGDHGTACSLHACC